MTTTDWEAYADLQPQTDEAFENEPVQVMRSEAMGRRAKGTTLDVGGGDGYQARLMRDNGAQVVVLDISEKRVERAAKEGFPARVGDACDLPYEDSSFDTVVLGEVVEHLDNPGQALAEAFRVAKDRVVVSLPLNGWADPTHQWRISLDDCNDPNQTRLEPTKGHQIVLTFQRGSCWPAGYARREQSWSDQFKEGR